MKQCKATTRRGAQCRNRASEGYHGYCKIHYAFLYQPKDKSDDQKLSAKIIVGATVVSAVATVVGAIPAIITTINLIVQYFPHHLFGEEPDGAAHRWLQQQLDLSPHHWMSFPHSYSPRTVAYKWSDLKELYQYCQRIQRDFEKSTDDSRAAKVLSNIDHRLAQWLQELDNDTREELYEKLQSIDLSKPELADAIAALPHESKSMLPFSD